MKPRKKTKLCLQCNGVNPISASHCAYCGALLSMEESEKVVEAPISSTAQDLFSPASAPFSASEQKAPAPYHIGPAAHSQAFVQDRQPSVAEEGVEKPLYSVFDQPETHQMGDLKDELLVSPRAMPSLQNVAERSSGSSKFFSKISSVFSKAEASTAKSKESSSQPADLKSALAAGSLAAGISLVFLSLLTFIFSQDGKVVLSWSEQTAAWLMLVSIGMIVFGLKASGQENHR